MSCDFGGEVNEKGKRSNITQVDDVDDEVEEDYLDREKKRRDRCRIGSSEYQSGSYHQYQQYKETEYQSAKNGSAEPSSSVPLMPSCAKSTKERVPFPKFYHYRISYKIIEKINKMPSSAPPPPQEKAELQLSSLQIQQPKSEHTKNRKKIRQSKRIMDQLRINRIQPGSDPIENKKLSQESINQILNYLIPTLRKRSGHYGIITDSCFNLFSTRNLSISQTLYETKVDLQHKVTIYELLVINDKLKELLETTVLVTFEPIIDTSTGKIRTIKVTKGIANYFRKHGTMKDFQNVKKDLTTGPVHAVEGLYDALIRTFPYSKYLLANAPLILTKIGLTCVNTLPQSGGKVQPKLEKFYSEPGHRINYQFNEKTEKYKCSNCRKESISYEGFLNHHRKIHQKRSRYCKICDVTVFCHKSNFVFEKRNRCYKRLSKHRAAKLRRANNKFICSLRPKKFVPQYHLKIHHHTADWDHQVYFEYEKGNGGKTAKVSLWPAKLKNTNKKIELYI